MQGIGGLGLGIGMGGLGGLGGMGGASSAGSGGESAAIGAAGGAGASTAANGSAAPIGEGNSSQSGEPSVMLNISPEGMNLSMGENSDLTAVLLMSLMDKANEQQQSTNGGILALALVGATAVNAYSSIQNMK